MRFLILSLLILELLLPGVYSGDVLVETRAKKLQCKNPKGKLGEASFYKCRQAVCRKSGNSATWDICPENAKETTVLDVQKKVKETEMIVKETENEVEQIKTKLNETEKIVKETEMTVKVTEKTLNKIEKKVNETEMIVNETGKTAKETENTVNKIDKKVQETEKIVIEIEKKISETEFDVKEIKRMLGTNLIILRGLASTNGIQLPVVYYNPLEFVIARNNLVTELASLGKEYILSFDLLLTQLDYIKNVIRLTAGGNFVYGFRTPGIWTAYSGNGFYMASAIGGNPDEHYTIRPSPPLQTEKWTHMEISQLLIDNKYMFKVKVDDASYWVVENDAPARFENVKVLGCDEGNPAPGKIKNLKVQTS